MANSPQAIKRARQNIKSREHNAGMRSQLRTYLKKARAAIEGKDKAAATQAYQKIQALLDNYARKGLVHANKAARLKSRLVAKLKAL